MSTYVPEIVPSHIMVDLLKSEWDSREGNIPMPHIFEANMMPENPMEVSLSISPAQDSALIVRPEPSGEKETLRDLGAQLKDVTFWISIDMYTVKSRQRLYDMKAEIRRIIHANMHSFQNESGQGYQVAWYRGFQDFAQNTKNIWYGIIRVESVNNKIAIDV